MARISLILVLLFATPVFAAPPSTCRYSSVCVSTTDLWLQVYSASFVYFYDVEGYDEVRAAELAEGRADTAVRAWQTRHAR